MHSGSKIIPPLEIIRSKNPLDLRVYLELCLLCNSQNDFELPKRETLSRLCNCSINSLASSLTRLSKTDFFKLRNPGLRQRRRAIVKVISFGEVLTTNELIETQNSKFSDALKAIHSKLRNCDHKNLKLSDISLETLSRISGTDDENKLVTALTECETYRPRNGKIFSMIDLFKSRFEKGSSGDCIGELKRTRKNISSENFIKKYEERKQRKEIIEQSKKTAPIHPEGNYDIERIILRLVGSSTVFLDEVPEYFKTLECFEMSADEIFLRENFSIQQIDKEHYLAKKK